MNKVYIVCYGTAGQDDRGNSTAFANIHGVYAFLDDAKKGLEECKNEIYDEIVNQCCDEDDEVAVEEVKATIQVYGSVVDDYFEIDHICYDASSEIHIRIVEKEIIG